MLTYLINKCFCFFERNTIIPNKRIKIKRISDVLKRRVCNCRRITVIVDGNGKSRTIIPAITKRRVARNMIIRLIGC